MNLDNFNTSPSLLHIAKQLQSASAQLQALFPPLVSIKSESEHKLALQVIEWLIEDDYDRNLLLIDCLAKSIERFEEKHVHFPKPSGTEK